MRLIDAEKLRADFLGMPNCYNGFSDTYDKAMIVDMVDEQPTVDAVPVVRCKCCEYFRQSKFVPHIKFCTNQKGMSEPEEDGFCSCGRRVDNV